MSSLLYRINHVLSCVVSHVPVGTNLGLFHLLWILLSGRLLQSRGAVIPGLTAFGLPAAAVRRAWAALAYGCWHTAGLLAAWQHVIQDDGHWQAHRHGGYRPVACDLVGFWRPRLQGCPTKHYCAQAGKALPAIPLGITARIGAVGPQRLAIPCLLVRAAADAPGEPALQMYRDRWPVEGLPLWAKQMLGAARQFVFAPESRQRLPAVALLAGSILAYTAATHPALPTGFWDRAPRPTAGRLRRVLAQIHFQDLQGLPEHLRKKTVTNSTLAHRRLRTSPTETSTAHAV